METLPGPDPTPAKRARRYFAPALRTELVALATRPGVSVFELARERGVNANQLFKWIRAARLAGTVPGEASTTGATMVPVTISAPAPGPAPHGSAHRADRAPLEIALAQATLRFDEGWDPTRVATLVRQLGS